MSEMRLQAQFDATLAANQRSISLAGVLMAAAAVLAGWAASIEGAASYIIGASALAMAGAAFLAWMPSRPRQLRVPGNSYASFVEDLEKGTDMDVVLVDLAKFNDEDVEENEADAQYGQRLTWGAMVVASLSIVLAVLAAFIL